MSDESDDELQSRQLILEIAELIEDMPRKIRQLVRDLEQAGFVDRGGKGSHRNFVHSSGLRVTLSGQSGDDCMPYQEREVQRVIEESHS
jgi:predicted RNA binding protein YcfA (HicA-like mRNA interferase family)